MASVCVFERGRERVTEGECVRLRERKRVGEAECVQNKEIDHFGTKVIETIFDFDICCLSRHILD